MTLSEYIQAVRDTLRDPNANFYSNTDLTRWINRARKQVAKVGECVRILPPSTAQVSSLTITSGGSDYVATPTVTIGAPDGAALVNATATATAGIGGGAVTSLTVTSGGAGYVETPEVTIEGVGTDASAMAILTPRIATVANQEKYTFASLNSVIQALTPGAGDILGIQSVSVSQGAMKPTLEYMPFTAFQAYLRSYPYLRTWPTVWSQYGQGTLGSFYVYPVPVQVTQMDVDCFCSVADLSVSQTVDLIPDPWGEAVIFYAAHLAYLFGQRKDDARNMMEAYMAKMGEARVSTDRARIPSLYPGGR